MAEYDWIGYEGQLAHLRQARWTSENIPDARVKLRFDAIGAVHAAVACGVGCASLPCFVGDDDRVSSALPAAMCRLMCNVGC